MPTKTISIDMEAYRRLKRVRRANESFSKVIKRAIRPHFDVAGYLDGLEKTPMSPAALKATEIQVSTRRATPIRDR